MLLKSKHINGESSVHLNWEGPPRNADNWAAAEVAWELVAVDCGAHEDQPQVWPLHDNILQDG